MLSPNPDKGTMRNKKNRNGTPISLVNTNANIINKILANWSFNTLKGHIPWPSRIYFMKARMAQQLQVNVIHHINKMKYKNLMLSYQ